ncbi:MAG: hypothetical protein GQ582_05880 [Methyloprofundus sp.]|nr:hypothetical protein [Methyloprofundus sp.]
MRKLLEAIKQQCNFESEQIQSKIDEYILIVKNIPIDYQYHYKSPELVGFYKNFELFDYNPFHKMVLLELIKRFDMESISLKLPPMILALYENEFARIGRLIEADDDFIFDWKNDLFAKDIGICSGRLLPIGPGLLEVSGVPRILLFKKGILQFLKLSYFLLFKLQRYKPILEIHTHLANVSNFTPKGWDQAYNIIAEILKLNPLLSGVMRSSWFIDPEIPSISPKLAYLTEIPLCHGAYVFYDSTEGRNSGAFARSKSRLLRFENKTYVPKIYFLIWPRDRLIQYKSSPDKQALENSEL